MPRTPRAPSPPARSASGLTSDRKRKTKGKATPAAGPTTTRPGDLVDAVRERSSMDRGKDQPL